MSLNIQTTNYNGTSIKYIEFHPSEYELKLVSVPNGGTKKSVSSFLITTTNAVAAINGSLMQGNYYEGGCKDSSGNLRGSFTEVYHTISYKNNVLSRLVLNDNDNLPTADFLLSSAFYCFLENNDNFTEYYPNETNTNHYTASEDRSMIGQKADGTIILAVTEVGGLTAADQAEFLRNLGYRNGYNLDGGFSRRLVLKGDDGSITTYGQNLSRDVLNALVVVPKQHNYLNGIRLRAATLQFCVRNTPVNGSILDTVYPGSTAQIKSLSDTFRSDGYQWAEVTSSSANGYSQLDTHNAYLLQLDSSHSTIYLKAKALTFRIRSAPVNGSTYTIVPVGAKAKINYVTNGFQSDGYQWANVTYNGYTGFAQIDLHNAYTIVS